MHRPFSRRLQQATLVNAVAKILGYSSIFLLWNAGLGLYASPIPLFATVFVLTLTGLLADVVIVPVAGTFWSLLAGLPAMVILTWWIGASYPGNHVTFVLSVLMAVSIAPLEYRLHRLVMQLTGLRNRR